LAFALFIPASPTFQDRNHHKNGDKPTSDVEQKFTHRAHPWPRFLQIKLYLLERFGAPEVAREVPPITESYGADSVLYL
jgi:hypothetical protein